MTAGSRPRVLMTLPDVAWPLNGGKRLRAEAMLRGVSARCDVDAVVLFADADPQVRPFPRDVEVGRWRSLPPAPVPAARAAAAVLGRRVPWQVAVHDWSAVRTSLQSWPDSYDLVWFGALDHAVSLAGVVRSPSTVVDSDDVETSKLRRFLDMPRSAGLPRRDRLQRRIELPLWARMQRLVLRQSDVVLVCSELDRRRLADGEDPGRIAVVPNTYPQPAKVAQRRPEGDCTVVVVANYGTDQNLDAAVFAATEVLPALRRRLPGVRLRLVGRRSERIASLAGTEGLDLVGPVDEVAAELSRAHVVLVPIRYGGGTRLKILEAFAHGVPVVTTGPGAEGLDVVADEHVLLANSPEELAAAVVRLVQEPGLGERLTVAGRSLWQSRYTPASAGRAVGHVLDRVLARPAGPR